MNDNSMDHNKAKLGSLLQKKVLPELIVKVRFLSVLLTLFLTWPVISYADDTTSKFVPVTAKAGAFLPTIVFALQFTEMTIFGHYTPSIYDDTKNLEIARLDNPLILKLANGKDKTKKEVRTCAEYADALKKGYSAASSSSRHKEIRFIATCGIIGLLKNSQSSKYSRFREEDYFWQNPDKLPNWFVQSGKSPNLFVQSAEENLCAEQLSLRECVEKVGGTILVHDDAINISANNINIWCQEIAHADFNGDDSEDILLQCRINKWVGAPVFIENKCLEYPKDANRMELFNCSIETKH